MGAYWILLVSPMIALVAMVVLRTPYRVILGKTDAPLQDTPHPLAPPPPPASAERPDGDAPFLVTVDPEHDFAWQAVTDPAPSHSSEALPPPVKRDEAAGATGARLVDIGGSHGARSFIIPATGVTIGRSPYTAEIVLANPRVSLRHAWIGFVHGDPVLRDLDSTNGTYLNGDLDTPVIEAPLRSGDTIFFANWQGERLRFELEGTMPSHASGADGR